MSVLRLNTVSLRYESHQVLRDVSFRLETGDRVGLIGANGTGKTSLLRLLLGQLSPTSGSADRATGLRFAYFSQFSTLDDTRSVQDLLEELFADVRAWEAELARIATALETEDVPNLTALLGNSD
jgi:ATPase subunit of ABC transporter with duplicated ATPase domains